MADVEGHLAGLLFEDAEECVSWSNQPLVNCFVGTFLTSSVVNFQSMRATLVNVWHFIGGISITDIPEDRYLFRLYHKVDVDRIVARGPWNFNSHLLILHRLKEGEILKKVPLNTMAFWVLIQNLPHGYALELVAKCMGDFIWEYVETDMKAAMLELAGVTRVRFKVDVHKPLK